MISADGKVILFESDATNLDPNATDGSYQLFARNLVIGTTTLVTINEDGTGDSNGWLENYVISKDGSTVAFVSTATNLDPLDTTSGQDVYVRKLSASRATLVSVSQDGKGPGNGYSYSPVLSANGNVVAFYSYASNLTSLTDANGTMDVFARDLTTGVTTLVSVNQAGTGSGNSWSESPSISDDGNLVAFDSGASNLTGVSTYSQVQVFLRNISQGTTTLVSVNQTGTGGGNNRSDSPMLSADGSTAAFISDATNIGSVGGSGDGDLYVKNLSTGQTVLASVNTTGTGGGNGSSWISELSGNGSVVVFQSYASNLVENDVNGVSNVFDCSLAWNPASSITGYIGRQLSFVANYTDPGAADLKGVKYSWDVSKTRNGQTTEHFKTGSDCIFSFTPDDDGTYVVTLTTTDKDGVVSTPATETVIVTDTPPTATITIITPSPFLEGSPIQLDGSLTDPDIGDQQAGFQDFVWTVTKEGTPGTFASGNTENFSFIPDDNGTYDVTFIGSDVHGMPSAPAEVELVVADVPPTMANPPALKPITEGGTATFSPSSSPVTFTDPGSLDTHTVTIDWGDGSTPTTLSLAAGVTTIPPTSHQYLDNPSGQPDGSYTISVQVTDKDGESLAQPATTTVEVDDAPPTAEISGAPAGRVPEGSSVQLTGTATDLGPIDQAAGFTYSWDVTKTHGTTITQHFETGSSSSFTLTTDDDGRYVVTLVATDKDGIASQVTSQTITAYDVAPTGIPFISVGGVDVQTVEEGQRCTFGLTSVADPGSAYDPSSADMAAGLLYSFDLNNDGTFETVDSSSPTASLTFTSAGTHVLRVRVEDKDGLSTDYSLAVPVQYVAPAVTADQSSQKNDINEGSAVQLTGSFVQPGHQAARHGDDYPYE